MSSSRTMPPIRRPGGANRMPLRSKRIGKRRRWPAGITISVSVIGIAVAILAWSTVIAQTRMVTAIGGYVLVITVGTAMLFVQRVLDVGVARLSGSPLISSFDLFDRLAFFTLLVASVSNGIVIALQVARQ